MIRQSSIKFIIPVMLLVVTSLLTGIFAGWYRLGVTTPIGNAFLHHGAIMTGSFLGTVILLERIVALKKRWPYLFPIINGSSVVFYLLELQQVAFVCLIIGAVGLFIVFYFINQIQSDLPHLLMWGASMAWLIGNVFLLMFSGYAQSILWWMAFLLITISAERLELNRFLPVNQKMKLVLIGFLLLFVVACLLPFHLGGRYLAGSALLLTGLWLLRYDMIWKAMKRPGIHRYSAVLLMCGYFWLLVSGTLYLLEGTGLIAYDALMHTFFIGFVFSMILAHAPIILPGVLGLSQRPFHPSLYIWGILLQLTLALRIIGNLLDNFQWKQWGGVLNGVVILCFLVNLVVITRRQANQ